MSRVRVARAIRTHFVTLLLAFISTSACVAQTEATLLDLATYPQTQLEIRSGTHKHVFDIWLAATSAQQQQGLMFVRDLAANRGMLFVAEEPRVFRMWMKNTYIPLDLVFIATDGRIAKIVANATPHSLSIISSDVPVGSILELKGGEATRRGVKEGDFVSWKPPA